ncbi:MAG: HEAT repeat domain-containing protein, partial [Candidatus Hydrogenedentes bacterium]|nr:HEAT repeat domain-containing protein [Candidatus Hydrogenedentota bacterium]
MNPIVAIHPEFSARFVMTLAHFLWQGAAIGLVAVALGAVLRRASARLRYGIFLIALLGMALCPPVTFLIIEPGTLPTPSAELGMGPIDSGMGTVDIEGDRTYGTYRTDRSDQPVRSDGSDPVLAASTEAKASFEATAPQANLKPADLELSSAPPAAGDWRDYTPYLILAYLAGVLVMLARLGLGLAGGGSLRKRAERITNSAILEAVRRNAQQLRLRAVPVVAYCQRVAVPTVVGVIRPMILLPASLATGMPPLQVELLLLHELTHIRRYDHVLNILQRIIEAALFFHPAVWYVSHRVRVEREHCCDDLVIALGGERHAYAESLISAAALASGMRLSPAALAATGKPSQLRKRIHRLLEEPAPPVRLVRGGWVLTALAIVALVAGATQLSGPTAETPVVEDLIELDQETESAEIVSEPAETLQVAEASESNDTAEAVPNHEEASGDNLDRINALNEQELNAKAIELFGQTQDPDWWLRKVAVQQLGELPHSTTVVQVLIGMLKDEDARVQAAAAEALAKQGDPQAVKHLVAALKEESSVREAAAEALKHFKREDVMPLLTLAARDDDMTVRLGAVLGLGKQNTADAAAILVGLLPEFYDEEPSRRVPLPPRPVRSRSNSLPVNPAELRPTGAAVAEALSAMDPAIARPALLDAATSTEWQTLMQTALVIGASDMQRVPDLQNALLGMLKHERKDVRAAAAQVLSETVKARVAEGESASPEVLAALEPLLRDPNRAITWIAADALRSGGWQPSSTEERAWFLVAIGQGQEASALGPVALEPFVHALNADSSRAFDQQGEETNPPRDIVQWLSELDDPGKVEPLISVLTRFGDVTTREIAFVLGVTGDPRAFEPLAGLLGHLNADVQSSAVWALGELKDPRAVEPLIAMLDHPNAEVRKQAIKALGDIGDPRAADAVRPFLENEDGLALEAAKALGTFKDAQSAPRIADLAGRWATDPEY